jgi:hypothetical protein
VPAGAAAPERAARPADKTESASKASANAAPAARERTKSKPSKEPAKSAISPEVADTGLLRNDIWLMRKRKGIIATYMRQRYNFFDGDTILGHSDEHEPILTLLLKGFEIIQPFLKTRHVIRDEGTNTLLCTIHVAGGRRNRKVLVEDAEGRFLWHTDFVRVSYISGFPLLGDDKTTLAVLDRGTLRSPDGEEWGRITGESAVNMQKALSAGKRFYVEDRSNLGLYVGVSPAAADRPDIKILLLSVAVMLQVVNIAYRF